MSGVDTTAHKFNFLFRGIISHSNFYGIIVYWWCKGILFREMDQ